MGNPLSLISQQDILPRPEFELMVDIECIDGIGAVVPVGDIGEVKST